MLLNYSLFYIGTLLTGVSIMIIMFKTSFAREVFEILKLIGFKKHTDFYDIGYGGMLSPKDWTDDDWMTFCNMKLGFLGRLFTCKYCFSCHVILWSNIFAYLICFLFGIIQLPLILIIFSIATQLPFIHLIFNQID